MIYLASSIMKNVANYAAILALVALTTFCVPHRSYVASPYEPLLTEKKGDIQVNAGFRPFKYYGFEVTAAPTDFMAIRAGYGGFFGLDNFSLSLPFFKNYQRFGFFVAPDINYQHNVIRRSISRVLINNAKSYAYNCEYLSPALVLGIKLQGIEDISHHLILKTQYNFVGNYYYYFEKDNGSGRSSGYTVLDNETLDYNKMPDFFSFEPTYVLINAINNNFSLKFHLGVSICQKVLRHKYAFRVGDYTRPEFVVRVTEHPRTLPLNIGIGILFNGNVSKKTERD